MNKKDCILVIEDDEGIRMPLVTMLQLEGFDVIEASDGNEGIWKAIELIPDIILCDIMMPQKDGYDVLLTIRKCDKLEYIPFLFLTAKSQPEEVRRGMNLGAEDYLTKPIDRQILLNSITARLSKKRRMDSVQKERDKYVRLQIASKLPHELLTPLNGILGQANLLELDADSIKPQEIKNKAQSIEQSVNILRDTIQKFLNYIELLTLSGEIKDEATVDTRRIILDCINKTSKKWSHPRDINASLIDLPIQFSPKFFEVFFSELIDNAFKFSEPTSPISIKTFCDKHGFSMEIVNQGALLPMNQNFFSQYEDFVQFEKKQFNQQGLGLGLSITKLILQQYDSTIEFKSPNNTSTSVLVTIPLPHS